MLKVGDRIPDFSINAEFGPGFSSDDIRGKRVVLYFYPKDDTPGCTKEACSFRDHLPRFKDLGVPVYGVSADDEKSHIRFARKFELNFPLVADPEHQLLSIFGTWVEKTMYGKKYFGVARSTFVIDAKGQVEKVWEQVTPDMHSAEVLAYLQAGTKQKPSPTPRVAVEAQKPKPSKPVIAKAKPGKSVTEPKPNKSKAKVASGKPKAKSKPSKPASKGPQVKKAIKSVAKPKKQIAKKKVSKPTRKPVLKKAVPVSKSKPKVSKKAAPVKKAAKKASVSKKTKKTKR